MTASSSRRPEFWKTTTAPPRRRPSRAGADRTGARNRRLRQQAHKSSNLQHWGMLWPLRVADRVGERSRVGSAWARRGTPVSLCTPGVSEKASDGKRDQAWRAKGPRVEGRTCCQSSKCVTPREVRNALFGARRHVNCGCTAELGRGMEQDALPGGNGGRSAAGARPGDAALPADAGAEAEACGDRGG